MIKRLLYIFSLIAVLLCLVAIVSCAPKLPPKGSTTGVYVGTEKIRQALGGAEYVVSQMANSQAVRDIKHFLGLGYEGTTDVDQNNAQAEKDIQDLENQIAYQVNERIKEHDRDKWIGWRLRALFWEVVGGLGALLLACILLPPTVVTVPFRFVVHIIVSIPGRIKNLLSVWRQEKGKVDSTQEE